jgi:hypothetical protein
VQLARAAASGVVDSAGDEGVCAPAVIAVAARVVQMIRYFMELSMPKVM